MISAQLIIEETGGKLAMAFLPDRENMTELELVAWQVFETALSTAREHIMEAATDGAIDVSQITGVSDAVRIAVEAKLASRGIRFRKQGGGL